jgi:chemotaxis response regulator CheB
MRLAIASMSRTQLGIMAEILSPIFPELETYSRDEIESGEVSRSSAHVMIIDYFDGSMMEFDSILNLLDVDEPVSILSEKDLYPLSHVERIVWRNKIVEEIVRLLPHLKDELLESSAAAAENDIWVIGSSSGGPDALRSFLSALPALPISLVLAQHIGSEAGINSLATLLNNRQNNWQVHLMREGQKIVPGNAYIVPRDHAASAKGDRWALKPFSMPASPSPCINATIRTLRRVENRKLGVVILSGLGDDGAASLKEIQGRAIMILAQAASECAASSMPDSARASGTVHKSGTTQELALTIAKHYGFGTA